MSWERDGLEGLWCPGLDHATVWNTRERRKPMLEILRRFTTTASVGGMPNGPVDVLDLPTELGA